MKKRNLFAVVAIATALMLNATDVLAVSPSNKTCQSGKVYTNYYFFADAEVYNGKIHSNDYTTHGNYNRTVLGGISISDLAASLENTKYRNDKLLVETGTIDVTRNNLESNWSTRINISDFWRYYKQGDSISGSMTAYLVSHTWNKVVNGQVQEVLATSHLTDSVSINQLANASVILNSDPTIKFSGYNNNKMEFQITRRYSKGLSTYANSLTTVPISGYNWYFNPAVFYINYCMASNGYTNSTDNGSFIIRYDANGGTNEPATSDITRTGTCAYVSNIIPNRNGYTFMYWKDLTNNKIYRAGDCYSGAHGDIKLTAIWSENSTPSNSTYSIVYKANTSDTVSNMPESNTYNTNSVATISTLTPIRNGYTFLGWSTKAGATEADSNYNGGTTYNKGEDLVLYAVWSKNSNNANTNSNNSNNNNSQVLPSNPKTGVEDYILPFGGVTLAALVGLGVLKKKKSFIQF